MLLLHLPRLISPRKYEFAVDKYDPQNMFECCLDYTRVRFISCPFLSNFSKNRYYGRDYPVVRNAFQWSFIQNALP